MRRSDRSAEKTTPEAEATQAYLDAAAVLTEFDPERIQPTRPVAPIDVRAVLADFSQTIISGNEVRWTLKQTARKQALQRLGNPQALATALQSNSEKPSTAEQRVYEQILTGRWDYVQFIGERALAAALQATEWLRGILDNLPDVEELRRRLDYARFVAPFERLADGFVGRTSELQKLHDYVGVLELRSSTEKIVDVFRGWLLKPKQGPLIVYGTGGVGKSALIARFVLEQDSNRLAFGGFPIVYLDFDNSSLRLDHPETLVKEAFRQVNLQYPKDVPQQDFIQDYDRFVAQQVDVPLPSNINLERLQAERFQLSLPFIKDWMQKLTGVRANFGAPFLIVFDTFEEVVSRSRLAIQQILTLCKLLQDIYPEVRTVISGRALETSFGDDLKRAWDKLLVSDFDPAAAQAYLANSGVVDPEIAQTVVKQLGGSPLTLKLAAEAIARGVKVERNTGFQNLQTRSWLVFSASETVIQGQLYERILGHIRNPDVPEVRQLAYPGLVLRRVTPELISEVLAGPCKLNLPSDPDSRKEAAQKLFNALRRETFLVDPRGVNSLRHRTDIRRVMLDMIEQKASTVVRTIHQAAVDYYFKNGTSPEDRAEEIYHRLKLGQDPASVNQRWIPGAGDYLGDAIPEVTPRARVFLASHLGVKLEDEEKLYKDASIEEWELLTARKVNEALTSRKSLQEILNILHERPERSASSPLYELEATALTNAGYYSQAAAMLETAINSVAVAGDRRLLGALLDLLANADVHLGQYNQADQLYQQIIEIAGDAQDRTFLLASMFKRASLAIRIQDAKRLQEIMPQLSSIFLAATDAELLAVKTISLDALAVSSDAQAPMILRAIEGGLFDYSLRRLASLLFQQSAANPEVVRQVAKLLFPSGASV